MADEQPAQRRRRQASTADVAEATVEACAKKLGVHPCHIHAFLDEWGECEGEAAIEALTAEQGPIDAPRFRCDPCEIYEQVDFGATLRQRFTRRSDANTLRHLRDLVVACSLVSLRLKDCLDVVLDADICDLPLAEQVYKVSVGTHMIWTPYRNPDIIGPEVQKAVADGVSRLVDACLAEDAAPAMEALSDLFRTLWSGSLEVRLRQASQMQAMILALFDDNRLAPELEPGCSPDGIQTVLGWCYRRFGLALDAPAALRGIAALAQLIGPASTYLWPYTPSTARRQVCSLVPIAKDAPIVRLVPNRGSQPDDGAKLLNVVKQVS